MLGADWVESVQTLCTPEAASDAKRHTRRDLLEACDRLRTQLGALGVAVEDEPTESRWELRMQSAARDKLPQAELKRLRLAHKQTTKAQRSKPGAVQEKNHSSAAV